VVNVREGMGLAQKVNSTSTRPICARVRQDFYEEIVGLAKKCNIHVSQIVRLSLNLTLSILEGRTPKEVLDGGDGGDICGRIRRLLSELGREA